MKNIFLKLSLYVILVYNKFIFFINSSQNKVSVKGFFFGRFKIKGTNNKIKIKGRNTNFNVFICGESNSIDIENGTISNFSIRITGDNNSIIIKKNRGISNTNIIVLGNNNRLYIDENTGIGGARIVLGCGDNYINIGKNNMISDNVEIWATDSHSIIDIKTNCRVNLDRPIVIKDNVWIGSKVCVLKGVTIHDDSVIGLGSIVVKDVPKNVISAGSPSKVLKKSIQWNINRI